MSIHIRVTKSHKLMKSKDWRQNRVTREGLKDLQYFVEGASLIGNLYNFIYIIIFLLIRFYNLL